MFWDQDTKHSWVGKARTIRFCNEVSLDPMSALQSHQSQEHHYH